MESVGGVVIAGAIIGWIAQNLLPYVINEGQQNWGAKLRKKANKLSKRIYAEMMKNQQTKELLMDAYQNRNTDLLNTLVNQAGYSTQAAALRKQIKTEREKYKSNLSKVNSENVELTNTYNTIQNASNQAGASFGSNKSASDTLKNVEKLINGGAENGQTVLPQK